MLTSTVMAQKSAADSTRKRTTTITVRILDNVTLKPLEGAVAVVDSSSMHGIANAKGEIEIKNVPRKEIELVITFMGYKEYRKKINTDIATNVVNLGIVKMTETASEIDEVTIDGEAPPVIQKGDTTQYNASGYKVNPDAMTEDLIKKLPGVKVDENGKIEAQGEEVKKVYVDGKELFGKDPTTAIKNLPANMVQSIQMFDEMDEQSKFSGYNSGNNERAFNIVTTKGLTSAGFGSAEAGWGMDEGAVQRYGIGGNAGYFADKQSFMINANTNNINQSRFGSGDMFGGGGRGGRFGGSQGLQKKTAAGVTYATELIKKLKLDFSYTFDNTDNTSERDTWREYFETDKVAKKNYGSSSWSNNDNYNHRASLNLEYDITPKDRIQFRSSVNFQNSETRDVQNAYNIEYGKQQQASLYDTINKNWSDNNNYRDGSGMNFSLLYMHAFDKAGRTFSLNMSANLNNSNNDSDQNGKTFSNSALNTGDAPIWDTINNDQYVQDLTNSQSYEATASYTEPLGKYSRLLFNYTFLLDNSMSDKRAYEDRDMMKIYDSISNSFQNSVMRNRLGMGYNYNDGKNNLSAGLDVEYNYQQKERTFPAVERLPDHRFPSLAPNITYNYYLEKRRYINVQYNGSTQVPSIEQLQGVVDNSNTLMLTAGNPDLKQAYRHSLRVRYNVSNAEKMTNFFVGINIDNTLNSIMNNTYTVREPMTIYGFHIDPTVLRGVRFSQPVNMNGNWAIRSMAGYSFQLKPIKSNINLDGSYRYSRQPSYYEQVKNLSNSNEFSLGVGLTSNISENIDFDLRSQSSYSFASNTSKTDTRYFSETISARVNIIFLKNYVFGTNLNYNYYSNASTTSFDDQYILWNASLSRKFLKHNRGEIKLSANDILKQNISYRHTINDTYLEDTRTNVLGRYFMATFTYRFSTMDKYKGKMPERGRGHGGRAMRVGGMIRAM